MEIQSTAALVLALGSAMFIGGAFLPVSRVYALATPGAKLELIQSRTAMWAVHQSLMGSGSAVTVLGLALMATVLQPGSAMVLAYTGVLAAAAGSTLWVRHVYLRIGNPAKFADGSLPFWQFLVYSVLTQAALLAFGAALFLGGFPLWMAIALTAGALFPFCAYLIFGDVPPFVYYLFTLAVGIGIAA
jgi:hypothetical protein